MKTQRLELDARVQFCAERALECAGQTFTPDQTSAYVEFGLSHAFPVVTSDSTALHPQVVANSHRSMLYKVFNLAHLMVANDPMNNPRDRILGSIVAVEFPAPPEGGWTVQADKAKAPGIRAVAVMHKRAETVGDVLKTWFSGDIRWTVSMEQIFEPSETGFLVQGERGCEEYVKATPKDLQKLGWTYIPAGTEGVPAAVAAGMQNNNGDILVQDYAGQKCVALFGGLNGTVHYNGVGLCPLGKEPEAYVAQMLASGIALVDMGGMVIPDFTAPLRAGLNLARQIELKKSS